MHRLAPRRGRRARRNMVHVPPAPRTRASYIVLPLMVGDSAEGDNILETREREGELLLQGDE